jgi:hypothetical protein
VEPIARKKVHFAPYRRQKAAIDRLLRSHRFRDVTAFMRSAIDHYLDHLGRPSLATQARQMADDWEAGLGLDDGGIQASAMEADERW